MNNDKEDNGDIDIECEQKECIEKEPGRCHRCQESCQRSCINCLKPILADYHPLPNKPNILERAKFAFMCPPHGRIGAVFYVVILGFVWYGVLWALVHEEALPGGNLFSLFLLFFFCWCGGYIIKFIHLPPLLGMLIVGGILGNVPGIDIARNINGEWGSGCRQIALAVILIRAGLGLDPAALRRLSFVVIRLAFSPCLAETIADGIAAHFILGFPWQWGFMLGFVIAAVSPAVVVPSLLSLSERGYGLDKGIPTLVIAAASVDDVLAITGFGVLLGITFSSGNVVWNIFKGPLEAVVGVIIGVIIGIMLWYFPQRSSKNLVLFRSTLLVGFSLLCTFGSRKVGWDGAGPLAVLTLAFVAAFRWRHQIPKGEKNPVEDVTGVLWMIFQPLLFGLIGAAVDISKLSGKTVGLGVAVLGIGLAVRSVVAFLAVQGTNFNLKERLFIPVAWLPKATVQAAIGAIAYDTANLVNDKELIAYGEKVLQLAVLSILLTAPIGAVLVAILGPILLHCTPGASRLQRRSELIIEDPEAQTALRDFDGEANGAVIHDTGDIAGINRLENQNQDTVKFHKEQADEFVTKF